MTNSGSGNYYELIVPLEPPHHELCIALLAAEGVESFLEEEHALHGYIPEAAWNGEMEAAIRLALQSAFGDHPPLRMSLIADRNWNEEWEASLQPIELSDRLLIIQSNSDRKAKPGQLVITINPKMSFGTGYHATTRLMLRQMEQLELADATIMDIGSGTGVLAIAARKLGNTNPIFAFDNSSWAVENAIENVRENHVDAIEVCLLDAEEDLAERLAGGYSLILANINKNVHDRILPVIARYAPQASVLLSGILVYDEPWLKKLVARLGYTIELLLHEEEWVSAHIKPGKA